MSTRFRFKDDELQKAFDNILDTFGGADGGVSFVHLRTFLERLENPKSMSEEDASNELLLIVKRFSKMIDIASGRNHK